MRAKLKQDLIDKTRLTYGLTLVLKDDVDRIRSYTGEFDIDNMYEAVRDATDTVDKLLDILAHIEYFLYLEKLES